MAELDHELRLEYNKEELAIGFYEWLKSKGYFKGSE
jgi:hypothetical protein